MKLLLIDDHPLILAGVRDALRDVDSTLDVTEVHDAAAALALVMESDDIDWICLDLHLPDFDGFDFLEKLKIERIPVPVVVLTAAESPATVQRALDLGVRGYIGKSAARSGLVDAFRTLFKGARYISPHLRRALDEFRIGYNFGSSGPGAIRLTRRQRDVLTLICEGLSNQEIATRLSVAESTIKGHVSTLLDLLDAPNRTTCARNAIELGLTRPR